MSKSLVLCLLLCLLSACGASSQLLYQDEQYQKKYEKSLIRLALYVEAQGDMQTEQLLQLWGIQSQRYINQHRDFLLKDISGAEIPKEINFTELQSKKEDIRELCTAEVQGVIYLKGKAKIIDQRVQIHLKSELYHCDQYIKLWAAEIDDLWKSKDQTVEAVIKMYENEIGKDIQLYIAPSFHAIRLLFEQLPYPKITLDRDLKDKIEMR
jgi:probable lipoprotein (TIGR04455 family)